MVAQINPDSTNEAQVGSRRGMLWTPEEEDLLVKLRNNQRLSWSEVTRSFAEQFPGRTQGSIHPGVLDHKTQVVRC